MTKAEDRVDDLEQQVQSLARRFEERLRSTDDRLDAARTPIDHLRLETSAQIDHRHRDLGRRMLLLLLGITETTAGLCIGTIVLLL